MEPACLIRCTAHLLLLAWLLSPVKGFSTGNETALRNTLFSGYDRFVRPWTTTNVSMTFMVTSLNSIDIKDQTMSISGWFQMSWTDSRLTWTPSDYDNIYLLMMFSDQIWKPVFGVYNSVDNLSAIDETSIPMVVFPTGRIEWRPPGILTVSCTTDITYFPFDTQTCGVRMFSIGYTFEQLVITESDINTQFYSAHGEWDLKSYYTESNSSFFTYVNFWFKYHRKANYYGLNIILPVIINSLLSMLIFMLPSESGEKMGYSLTVLLAFVVLMSLLGDRMPTTADHTSVLEVYIIIVLSFCGMSVVFSIINLALYFRCDSKPVPDWARRLTVYFMQTSCKSKNRKVAVQQLQDMEEKRPPPLPAVLDGAWDSPKEGVPEVNDDVEVTWKIMADTLDWVCLRVYATFVVLITLIFLIVMVMGESA